MDIVHTELNKYYYNNITSEAYSMFMIHAEYVCYKPVPSEYKPDVT